MPEAVRIDICGPITPIPWDVTEVSALQIANRLQAAGGADIELHINSPGGSAHEGMAIANAMRAYKGKTLCIVDGLCASAATAVAASCNETWMHEASHYMIHESATIAMGFAEDLEKQAAILRQINDLIADLYVRKTGATREQVMKWMSEETWFKPAEAKAAGFCDKVIGQTAAKIDNRAFAFLSNSYRNVPAHLRVQALAISTPPPRASQPPRKATPMDRKQIVMNLAAALAVAMEYAKAGAESGDQELAEACNAVMDANRLPACSSAIMPLAQKEDGDPAAEQANFAELLRVYQTAKDVTGAKEGVAGALEALKKNADRKASVADVSIDVQVEQVIRDGVKACKILPAEGEQWRAAVKSGARTLSDLKSFIRNALPAGEISGEETRGAKDETTTGQAAASADDEPTFTAADFEAAANQYKIGGGVK